MASIFGLLHFVQLACIKFDSTSISAEPGLDLLRQEDHVVQTAAPSLRTACKGFHQLRNDEHNNFDRVGNNIRLANCPTSQKS